MAGRGGKAREDAAAETVPDPDSGQAPRETTPRKNIGRFVIERELGSGGMGIVYAAHDPVLDRRVALKLIRPEVAGATGETRLIREAQALARLADPNVVTVHEAGAAGNDIYVAMELVDGMTLREWSQRERRPWREVVATYFAAGRGLLAAHTAGMVHRDFKPANVFIDRDGRVKVGDFGLVGATAGDGGDDAPRALSATVTNTGSVLGTPAYMAPEQKRGDDVDARADQYAYCKSLDEALDAAREPGPARLRTIVQRGLAEDPARRYPSMREVLRDLHGVLHRRRRIVTTVAAVALAGAIGGTAALLARSKAPEPCGNLDDLAGVWDAAKRDGVRAKLVAADPDRGAARFDAVAAVLDPYADGWRAMQLDACRANRVTHAESDTLYDRRTGCLKRRRDELVAVLAGLEGVRDKVAVDSTIAAANRITDLRGCADSQALLAAVPPPENPDARREADAIAAELDAIDRERVASHLDGLEARSSAALVRARKLGHAPTTAAALKSRIEIDRAGKVHRTAGTELVRELTEVAAAAHDDVLAAWAWGDLVFTLAYDLEKPADAMALLPAGRAALARAPDDPATRANFLYDEGTVLALAGKTDDGLKKLEEAEKLLADKGPKHLARTADIVLQQGILRAQAGQYTAAEPVLRRAIELYTRAYGADHPEAASAWGGLAFVLRQQSKVEDALAADRQSLRIRSSRTGDTPLVANDLMQIAYNLKLAGNVDEARTAIERAVKILRGADDAPSLAAALMTAGTIHEAAKDQAAARKAYDESIALFEARAPDNLNLAIALFNRGVLTTRGGGCQAALVDLQRSLAMFEKLLGDKHPNLAFPLSTIGSCFVQLRRFDEAEALFARIDAIGPDVAKELAAIARFYRARALVDSGRDRAGGLAAARKARDELQQMGGEVAADLPEIDAWFKRVGQ